MAEKITSQNMSSVLSGSDTYLLDFWAAWCMPCSMMSRVMEETEPQLAGRIKIGKINIGEEPVLAQTFGVTSIPTLFIVKGGKAVASAVGFMEKDELLTFINKNI